MRGLVQLVGTVVTANSVPACAVQGFSVSAPPLTKAHCSRSRAMADRRTMALEQTRMATACGTSNGGCDSELDAKAWQRFLFCLRDSTIPRQRTSCRVKFSPLGAGHVRWHIGNGLCTCTMPTNYGVRYHGPCICALLPMCNLCVTVQTSMPYGAHSICWTRKRRSGPQRRLETTQNNLATRREENATKRRTCCCSTSLVLMPHGNTDATVRSMTPLAHARSSPARRSGRWAALLRARDCVTCRRAGAPGEYCADAVHPLPPLAPPFAPKSL
jgi:hypothetical protein